MKKLTRCIVMTLSLLLVLMSVTACGGNSSKNSLCGTWTPESAEVNGSTFTVKELEALDDYSISDLYVVLKDGGAGYVYSGGNGATVEWSKTDSGVKIGVQECAIKDGKILLENNGITITLVKTSDSQSIVGDDSSQVQICV